MQIKDRPNSGAPFFKPAEHEDDVAILVEVNKFERDRPGKFGPKDAIHATIHTFATDADVEAGKAEVGDFIINNAALVSDLSDLVGEATIVKLGTAYFKNAGKDGPVWRDVDSGTKAKVVKYANEYEAALEAAIDEAPDDFGDDE